MPTRPVRFSDLITSIRLVCCARLAFTTGTLTPTLPPKAWIILNTVSRNVTFDNGRPYSLGVPLLSRETTTENPECFEEAKNGMSKMKPTKSAASSKAVRLN